LRRAKAALRTMAFYPHFFAISGFFLNPIISSEAIKFLQETTKFTLILLDIKASSELKSALFAEYQGILTLRKCLKDCGASDMIFYEYSKSGCF
jgi:hypothetical protein